MASISSRLEQIKQKKLGGSAQPLPQQPAGEFGGGFYGGAGVEQAPGAELIPPPVQPQPAQAVPPAEQILSTPTPQPEQSSLPGPDEEPEVDVDREIVGEVAGGNRKVLDAVPVAPSLESYADEIKLSIDKLNEKANKALSAYKVEKDSIKQQELWESLVGAFGMIAAGMYGLNTGSDMSGVKFNKTDWDKKLQLAQSELNSALKDAERQYAVSRDLSRQKRQDKVEQFQMNEALRQKAINEAWRKKSMEFEKEKFEYQQGKDAIDQQIKAAAAVAKGSNDKEAVKLLDNFNKMAKSMSEAQAKDADEEVIENIQQQLISLNSRFKARTGKAIVPPAALARSETFLGIFGGDLPSGSDVMKAANVESQGPALTNDRGWKLNKGSDGNLYYVNPSNPKEYEKAE